MDNFFLWLAHNFDKQLFYKSTAVQGFFWSIADFCVVFAFLKLASLVRKRTGMTKTTFRYIFFWAAAALNPYFLFVKTGNTHDALILGVFSLLLYAALVDGLRIFRFIEHGLAGNS